MRDEKRESGLTLVEVLATVIIISFVLVLVFSILFSGLKVSSKAESNSYLQREANYLIFALKKVHESGNDYTITVDDVDKFTLNKGMVDEQVIGKKNYDYVIKIDGNPVYSKSIYPKDYNKKILIDLTIFDTKNNREYSLETTLSRL